MSETTERARRLLDAARGDSEDGNTGDELFDMFSDDRSVVWPDGDHVATVFPGVMTGVDPQAFAEFVAAAPELVAGLLAELDEAWMERSDCERERDAVVAQRDALLAAIGDHRKLRVTFPGHHYVSFERYLRSIADAAAAVVAAGEETNDG